MILDGTRPAKLCAVCVAGGPGCRVDDHGRSWCRRVHAAVPGFSLRGRQGEFTVHEEWPPSGPELADLPPAAAAWLRGHLADLAARHRNRRLAAAVVAAGLAELAAADPDRLVAVLAPAVARSAVLAGVRADLRDVIDALASLIAAGGPRGVAGG